MLLIRTTTYLNLIPERGQMVEGLKGLQASRRCSKIIVTQATNKVEDEHARESNTLRMEGNK